MPNIRVYIPIRKLIVSGNVSFVLVSYAFADVHFLHFGELKMRFLHIAQIRYRKYIRNNFGCLDVSIHVAI